MAGDHELRDRPGRREDFLRRIELGLGQFPACRDARTSRVEPQDRRFRAESAQPGKRALGSKLTKILLKAARVMGAERVAIVVPGNDRHPSWRRPADPPGRPGPRETRPAVRSWSGRR